MFCIPFAITKVCLGIQVILADGHIVTQTWSAYALINDCIRTFVTHLYS